MQSDACKSERETIDAMANILYDHFNPDKFRVIKVGKSVCIDMATAALKLLRERMPEQPSN